MNCSSPSTTTLILCTPHFSTHFIIAVAVVVVALLLFTFVLFSFVIFEKIFIFIFISL